MKFLILGLLLLFISCKKEEKKGVVMGTEYKLEYPAYFGENFTIPDDNPITNEGVELGRRLFYDKILSKNRNISCASCHKQANGFSDTEQFSFGTEGKKSARHSMVLVNLLWQDQFFWDGRSNNLEEQAIDPIIDENEMNLPLDSAVYRLSQSGEYQKWFTDAFGSSEVTPDLIGKAIAQFERTLISGNSKYDQYKSGNYQMTSSEYRGMELFFTHPEPSQNLRGGNCADCHSGFLTSDRQFHNNGLDIQISDRGQEVVTGNARDLGKFKTPTLRNVAVSAPYMHDGRFNNLEEVLDHYNEHVQNSENVDLLIIEASNDLNGKSLSLTEQEKKDIINFLHTLTDEEFLNNQKFKNPF